MIFSIKMKVHKNAKIQYVAPGPRSKIIVSNISPEEVLHELKFSLKIVFMSLVITVKCQLSKWRIFLVILKKN